MFDPVQSKLDDALRSSAAFHELSPEQQRRMRDDLQSVMGVVTESHPRAVGFDDPPGLTVPNTGGAITNKPAMDGSDAMKSIRDSIGFGEFVKELITNVYDAIVNSSISQMQAYQKLMEAAVGPVGSFANDNISDNDSMNYLMGMFPSSLQMGQNGQLSAKPGGASTADVSAQFPGMGSVNFNNPNDLKKITTQAKLQLARQRQQLLATMVMMGINRIVVTDGHINAKMNIQIDTSESLNATNNNDRSTQNQTMVKSMIGGSGPTGLPVSAQASAGIQMLRIKSTTNNVDQSSDASVTSSANLMGEVKIAFKSETMPLDKFADPMMQQVVAMNADPKKSSASSAAAAAAAAPAADPAASTQSYGGRGRALVAGSRGTYGAPFQTVVVRQEPRGTRSYGGARGTGLRG